jgi:hypothetical protein
MQEFAKTIISNWAAHFNCETSFIRKKGTYLQPDEKYAGKNMVTLWHIEQRTFALFDPILAEVMNEVLSSFPADSSITGENVKQLVGRNRITSHDIGLIHYLYPPYIPSYDLFPEFSVRKLSIIDGDKLSELHNNCTSEEVEDAYVEINHEIVFGCFHNDELVSAASGYRMAGFMDIGVLTNHKFRRLGLGKAVVANLCNWSIDHDVIAQYRCNSDNAGSRGVAEALNFRLYYTSESLIMKD